MSHSAHSVYLRAVILVLCAIVAMPLMAAEKPSSAAVERWARVLPESPRGVGRPIVDRKAWQAVAAAPTFKAAVSRGEQLLGQPIPELTDQLYLDYSRTGNRVRCEGVLGDRQFRFCDLAVAECIENRGRFLPAIEEAIKAVCGDKTWVLPAHDGRLTNFKGTEITIDLRSSEVGWNLATVRYWLGDKLSEKSRKLIDQQLERRIFAPFAGAINEGKPRMSWLTVRGNHNAVDLAGVSGAAMANIPSRQRRAFFAASAEKYVQNYLLGFTPDGYCSEGVGYWNYGFGRFVMLAETLKQASGGAVDMMQAANVRQIALFGRRMEILPGIYPSFADCDPTEQPDVQIMAFLSRRCGWGLRDVESKGLGPAVYASGFTLGVFGFPNSATATAEAHDAAPPPPSRDWFANAGVLICRPMPGQRHALGAAMKGGHNAEQHNHNDVGSFIVALGAGTPLVDPGPEVYTGRTFSAHRYDSKVLSSFGHSVPRVAGRLQETGKRAAARVLKTDFTAAADTLVLDISAAYKVKGLKRLERTFVFSREGAGKLTLIDSVEFDSPQAFGTALITFGGWKRLDARRLRIGDAADDVTVEIVAAAGDFAVSAESIHENLPDGRTPIRLGIDFTRPVTKADIRTVIVPSR